MIQGEPSAPTVAPKHQPRTVKRTCLLPLLVLSMIYLDGFAEEVVSQFINSDEFGIYQEVAGDPDKASDDLRKQFVSIVDAQLGNMSEESVNPSLPRQISRFTVL